MASWKKLVYSGSNAHLTSITASNITNDNLVIGGTSGRLESSGLTYNGTTFKGASIISASIFSGSFRGNGSLLTGVSATSLDIDAFGSDLTGISIADTDKLILSDAGTDGRINASQIPVYVFTKVSGDITIASNGVAAIAANSVVLGTDTTGSYVAKLGTGTGVTIGSNTGEGANPTISVNYGSSASTAVQGNTALTIQGTSNEIEVTNGAITLGTGGTVTVGLPDNVSITSNLIVGGNLTVQGTLVNLNTTNLDVEDAYITLKSGSAVIGDSGIIFGGANGVAQSGVGLFWDASYNSNDGRLSIINTIASNATGDQTPSYYLAAAYIGTEANAATAEADHPGNIRIDGSDIYIYV